MKKQVAIDENISVELPSPLLPEPAPFTMATPVKAEEKKKEEVASASGSSIFTETLKLSGNNLMHSSPSIDHLSNLLNQVMMPHTMGYIFGE